MVRLQLYRRTLDNPVLADKIRGDRLLECDLFEVRQQFSTIIAVMTRQVLPYRAATN